VSIARSNALIRVPLKTPAMSVPLCVAFDCASAHTLKRGNAIAWPRGAPGLRLMFPQPWGKHSCGNTFVAIFRNSFKAKLFPLISF
jgi:hypothetical protein